MIGVMQMKKALIVILSLILLLTGLFLWKGGHHAIALAGIMEEWLDEDDADQSFSLQVQLSDAFNSSLLDLQGDSFWTEFDDRRLFGVSVRGLTAYTDGKNLYMDTGNVYGIPELPDLRGTVRRFTMGLLLYGRVTKENNIYYIDMKTGNINLHVGITADRHLRAAQINAVLSDGTAVTASMETTPSVRHTIGQAVRDAMVHSRMEPPMSLSEPLEILLPAMSELMPLSGELNLSVECGILNVSDTALLRINGEEAELERNGTTITIPLPDGISRAEPAALALLLLRNGTFVRGEGSGEVRLDLPPEVTEQLCCTLIPKLSELSMEFGESQALLTFRDDTLTSVTMTAASEVPFLITTIPLSFRAELLIP